MEGAAAENRLTEVGDAPAGTAEGTPPTALPSFARGLKRPWSQIWDEFRHYD